MKRTITAAKKLTIEKKRWQSTSLPYAKWIARNGLAVAVLLCVGAWKMPRNVLIEVN